MRKTEKVTALRIYSIEILIYKIFESTRFLLSTLLFFQVVESFQA